MLLESPKNLSGITISPGRLLASNEFISGISFYSGQAWINVDCLYGLILADGQIVNNFNARFPPDIFKLIFGDNATQTLTTITIVKSDLGLTTAIKNTAESLLVGIIARNLQSQRKIFTQKIDFEYWGYGVSQDKRIDTLVINIFNLLSANITTNEISLVNNNINPNDY